MRTAHGSSHAVTFPDVEPPRRFTMQMSGPPLTTFTFSCEVRPNGSGSTIAHSVAFSGRLASVFARVLGAQLANQFVHVLDDLAAAAEAT